MWIWSLIYLENEFVTIHNMTTFYSINSICFLNLYQK
jgi:hypothetical protein